MSVGLLEGFAESDVIRLIAFVELRKWLDFKDDSELLERYWTAARRRRATYACVRELKGNYDTVQSWCSFHLSRFFGRDGFFPIRRLQISAARSLIEEEGRPAHYMLEPYLQTAEQLNSQVDEMERNWTGDKQALINRLAQAHELSHLMFYVREMYRDLLQSVDFAFYTLC